MAKPIPEMILTGQVGKAQAALSKKATMSKLDKAEDEATKVEADFDGSNLMRPDGSFAAGSTMDFDRANGSGPRTY